MEKWKDKPLNPKSLPVVVKACEEAFVYVNELLIDNAVDIVSGKKIASKLHRALKKAGRLSF